MRFDRVMLRSIACGAALLFAGEALAQAGVVIWHGSRPVNGGYEATYTYTNLAYACSAAPGAYDRYGYRATYVECRDLPWWGNDRRW